MPAVGAVFEKYIHETIGTIINFYTILFGWREKKLIVIK